MSGGNGNGKDKFFFSTNGIPFMTKRDTVPLVKETDPFYKKPQDARKVRVDVFNLWEPKHWELYQKIWELVGCGVATVAEEQKQFLKHKENWKIFIRWFLHTTMEPGELRSRRSVLLDEVLKDLPTLYSGQENSNEHGE